MTIKLTKWIHSQRKIVNLQLNASYALLNAHEIGLQPNLIISYLYLFTLHRLKVVKKPLGRRFCRILNIIISGLALPNAVSMYP